MELVKHAGHHNGSLVFKMVLAAVDAGAAVAGDVHR
jgi:hypothetical protein